MKEQQTAADIFIDSLATGMKAAEPILPSRRGVKEVAKRTVIFPIFQRMIKAVQRRRFR